MFLNQKGGVGKSTCAFNLAIELTRKEKKVIVIDFDKQRTLSELFKNRKNNKIIMHSLSHVEDAKKLISNIQCNYLIIDTPGIADNDLLVFAKELQSLIIVPTSNEYVDAITFKNIISLLIAFDFTYFVLLNKINPNLTSTKEELLSTFKNNKIHYLESTIKNLKIYARSVINGLSSNEQDNKNIEFVNLANEIIKRI